MDENPYKAPQAVPPYEPGIFFQLVVITIGILCTVPALLLAQLLQLDGWVRLTVVVTADFVLCLICLKILATPDATDESATHR